MQSVAQEMNLSETAFVQLGGDVLDLRWFTPVSEVEMCGHATLATAHILWEVGTLSPDERARFETASGLLAAERHGDLIELDFPAKLFEDAEAPAGLEEALGLTARHTARSRMDYLVVADAEETVRELSPDFAKLRSLPVRGVIVSSESSSADFDFVSRFFAPAMGIDEDPVTGSAHCFLGPFWSGRLGKSEMVGFQASQRGGEVGVRVDSDRVYLCGRAVTVIEGDLVDL
jgi:PhzF family phenazine biosynthesis protein